MFRPSSAAIDQRALIERRDEADRYLKRSDCASTVTDAEIRVTSCSKASGAFATPSRKPPTVGHQSSRTPTKGAWSPCTSETVAQRTGLNAPRATPNSASSSVYQSV